MTYVFKFGEVTRYWTWLAEGVFVTLAYSLAVLESLRTATRAPVRFTVSTMSVADWSMTRWSYAFNRILMRCPAITKNS